jgi:hypothetical protein
MEKLISLFNGKDDELRDVAGLGQSHMSASHNRCIDVSVALKTVMTNIPDSIVGKACAKVGPRLLKQLQNVSPVKDIYLCVN